MIKFLQESDNPDYVLIHKKALLINSSMIARLARLLAKVTHGLEADEIAEEVGDFVRNKIHSLSTQEINDLVKALIDGADTNIEKGLTVVDSSKK